MLLMAPQACSAAVSLLSLPKQAPQTRSALSLGGLALACVPKSADWSELETSGELGRGRSPWLCPQDSRGPCSCCRVLRMVWVFCVPITSRRISVQVG